MRSQLSPRTIETLTPHVSPDALRRMRVMTGRPWRWFPQVIRMAAVTFGDHVLMRPGRFDETTPRGLALIAHEAMHVAQYRRYGRIGMCLRYLAGQFRCGFIHDRHHMERPCIEVQVIVRALLEKRVREGVDV
ncbi:MAG: DUF4157 domain-containing protein [Tepidiformaceae bacterium]